MPPLLRHRKARDIIAVLEALRSWTRRVGDLVASGAGGLEQAITASARAAPEPIAEPVAALAARIRTRGMEPALRAFADDLADPAVDEVVMALILRVRAGGRGLVDVLDAKAASLATEVATRREVEADRAKPRTQMRAILAITLGVVGLLIAFGQSYLEPFHGVLGQLVMAAVVLLFAVALWWMHTLSDVRRPPRMLRPTEHPEAQHAPDSTGQGVSA